MFYTAEFSATGPKVGGTAAAGGDVTGEVTGDVTGLRTGDATSLPGTVPASHSSLSLTILALHQGMVMHPQINAQMKGAVQHTP